MSSGYPRHDERDGIQEHGLLGAEIPEDEEEDDSQPVDPDVLIYYDELRRMKQRKELH